MKGILTVSHHVNLTISKQNSDKDLSPEQVLFNKLLRNIDKEKQKLLSWKDIIPNHQSEYLLNLKPLQEEMNSLKIEFIIMLDQWHQTKKLNKTEKSKINFIITDLLGDVIAINGSTNLKDIYNRHTSRDIDKDIEREKNDFIEMVSTRFGIELEDDFDSPQEAAEKAAAKLKEKMRHDDEMREKKRSARKKSTRTIEKEKRLADEMMQVSQSIKEVHRKLVLALHPDKESDSEKRERKTLLMQQINTAYKNNDLLKLLELQIESEIADKICLNEVTSERLCVFNKILTTQLRCIREEVRFIQDQFRMMFNISHFEKLDPLSLIKRLEKEIKNAKADILAMKRDLLDFRDVKNLKLWLSAFRPARSITMDDIIFELFS